MMFIMHSKSFFNLYLQNEDYKDILKANYVCVSTRIRRRNANVENVIVDMQYLYPSTNVLMKGSMDEMENAYYEQLDTFDVKVWLSGLIYESIVHHENVIFLCTRNEWKLKYLIWLMQFIYNEFGYPVYWYDTFIMGSELLDYDRQKVIKKVRKYIEAGKERQHEVGKSTKIGKRRLLHEYESMSKKELRKILKKADLYHPDMDSKQEMLEMIETFFIL